MNKITAADIKPNTHVWVGDKLVFVSAVRTTALGPVSINGGEMLLAADRVVVEN